ncbi:carbohydrate ABC transporter permease [Paenibacillus thalictri]|uniref:Carbohydrate ABC transporter permease n=1 Tax=Paenibacillus thalictri TaxID=2527873 RepID=A0A4Q9DZP0_9BACL|nr:carbohydrate ABC transporter permease [Paenibacillus thalictri]TBL80751.1 carbohydrate ABC transporter permease [Paenibacillus thalictri]
MLQDKSFSGRLFDLLNGSLLLLISLITIVPFVYVLAASFTAPEALLNQRFTIFPTTFSFDAYRYIFSTPTLIRSLLVTVWITVAGTFVNLLLTSLMAYPLVRRDLDGRRAVMLLVLFTMLFSGGMIPTFLVVKQLGLLNTYWSVILVGAINPFNLIVLRSFFQQLPTGLEESAKIDGCNDLGIFFRIVLPLSMPAMATFALFYSVGHWNSFFSAILYINDHTKWPIQVLLRQIVILSEGGIGEAQAVSETYIPVAQTIKMAVIIVSTLPILCVYPFLQKHFAKGVMLGSIKG